MPQTNTLLVNIRRIMRLYDNMLKPICERHALTPLEVTIISFLYNNPGRDTAADIVELRMLSRNRCFSGGKTRRTADGCTCLLRPAQRPSRRRSKPFGNTSVNRSSRGSPSRSWSNSPGSTTASRKTLKPRRARDERRHHFPREPHHPGGRALPAFRAEN